MTLISIQSRIHFAAHVLEEALRAELDEANQHRLLVVSEARLEESELAARVTAGLPERSTVTHVVIAPHHSKYDTRDAAMRQIAPEACDAVIAFGSARAIAFARKCRQEIATRRYAAVPAHDRKRLREKAFLPEFYAIPGIDGLPDPCTAQVGSKNAFKIAPPSVIICDPSIVQGAAPRDAASAYANALGRCLEALASAVFNPIADGLAVEGLRRLVLTRGRDGEAHSAQGLRNLMAASLASAMAQEKGPGAIQVFAGALAQQTGRDIDVGSVKRILLPWILGDPAVAPADHDQVIRDILHLRAAENLQDGLARHLDALPLARQFNQLDLARAEVDEAARTLLDAAPCALPTAERFGAILDATY